MGESETGFVEDVLRVELPDSIYQDPQIVDVQVIARGEWFLNI